MVEEGAEKGKRKRRDEEEEGRVQYLKVVFLKLVSPLFVECSLCLNPLLLFRFQSTNKQTKQSHAKNSTRKQLQCMSHLVYAGHIIRTYTHTSVHTSSGQLGLQHWGSF